ncbi:hypothetical protein [Silvimonas amylolytica]|uniref:Disulfide bond formation protein DsbB n=1 Tax=Silvimonas amylolytica TaxID=449663 RepID=A0ABQ2PLJ1_9NEIS|nr:hypothetical protein [Silvimonas amylolytica]GGP25867.1 hypothetical protein GCM10010971_16860 [Silvimonas amylolytica]
MFLFLFLLVMLGSPILFIQSSIRIRTAGRILIAIIPVTFTGVGYGLASLVANHCAGGLKDIHDCILWGSDVSRLVEDGMFLGIWFIFGGIPLSLAMLIGFAWDTIQNRQKPAA